MAINGTFSYVTLKNQLHLKEIRTEKLDDCGLMVRLYSYTIYIDSMGHILEDSDEKSLKCLIFGLQTL